jgi:branched-subunit amino acid aminotransferase/4-amino-4-deoxychorismate lyase
VTGLIETVRVVRGRAPLWDLHVERVRAAAEALGLGIAPPPAPAGGEDRVVRYELHPDNVSETSRESSVPASLRLHASVVPHPDYPWKTDTRESFNAAFVEAQAAGADDALLLSVDDLVREASRWAIIWRREDGRIGAPPLAAGVLRSVARARLALILDGGIVEEELDLGRLVRRPVAALNAARGLVRVEQIGSKMVPEWDGWSVLAARFWP